MNIPAGSGHRAVIVTYAHYAGALSDTSDVHGLERLGSARLARLVRRGGGCALNSYFKLRYAVLVGA